MSMKKLTTIILLSLAGCVQAAELAPAVEGTPAVLPFPFTQSVNPDLTDVALLDHLESSASLSRSDLQTIKDSQPTHLTEWDDTDWRKLPPLLITNKDVLRDSELALDALDNEKESKSEFIVAHTVAEPLPLPPLPMPAAGMVKQSKRSSLPRNAKSKLHIDAAYNYFEAYPDFDIVKPKSSELQATQVAMSAPLTVSTQVPASTSDSLSSAAAAAMNAETKNSVLSSLPLRHIVQQNSNDVPCGEKSSLEANGKVDFEVAKDVGDIHASSSSSAAAAAADVTHPQLLPVEAQRLLDAFHKKCLIRPVEKSKQGDGIGAHLKRLVSWCEGNVAYRSLIVASVEKSVDEFLKLSKQPIMDNEKEVCRIEWRAFFKAMNPHLKKLGISPVFYRAQSISKNPQKARAQPISEDPQEALDDLHKICSKPPEGKNRYGHAICAPLKALVSWCENNVEDKSHIVRLVKKEVDNFWDFSKNPIVKDEQKTHKNIWCWARNVINPYLKELELPALSYKQPPIITQNVGTANALSVLSSVAMAARATDFPAAEVLFGMHKRKKPADFESDSDSDAPVPKKRKISSSAAAAGQPVMSMATTSAAASAPSERARQRLAAALQKK
jgi:hypothetical protein